MAFTGRGGFGNYSRQAKEQPQALPVQHFAAASQKIRTGRGGFGNTVKVEDIDIYSEKELLVDQQVRAAIKPNYYMIGRGGSGNHITPQLSTASSVSTYQDQHILSPYNSSPVHNIRPLTSRIWQKITPAKTR